MKSANYSVALSFLAIAASFSGCSGFVSPNPIVGKISRPKGIDPTNKSVEKIPVAFASSTGDVEDDDAVLAALEIDAVVATKELALNWGFVFQSGVSKVIGGTLALFLPMFATGVALNGIAISLAVISVFNVISGFTGEGDSVLNLQSLLLGAAQAFFSYRILFNPFESLAFLTTLVASTSILDGVFETFAALLNSDLPGRWFVLLSGLASIVGGAFVATNIVESSLVVLGLLFGSGLLTSGVAGIRAALLGRQIASKYLVDIDFAADV